MHSAHEKPHWMIRLTPEFYRARVFRFGVIFGAACRLIWTLGAFAGFFLGPVLFAAWRRDAPLSQPVHWLRRVADGDSFIVVYSFLMLAVVAIVYSGHTLLQQLLAKAPKA